MEHSTFQFHSSSRSSHHNTSLLFAFISFLLFFFFLSLQIFLCCCFVSVHFGSLELSKQSKTNARRVLVEEKRSQRKTQKKKRKKRDFAKKRATSSCFYLSDGGGLFCVFDGFRTRREKTQSMAICWTAQTFTHVHREKVINAPVVRLHSLSCTHIHACCSRESEERYQLWWVEVIFFIVVFL